MAQPITYTWRKLFAFGKLPPGGHGKDKGDKGGGHGKGGGGKGGGGGAPSLGSWAVYDETGTLTLLDSENVDSLVDNAVGDTTINWTVDFSGATYAMMGGCLGAIGGNDEHFVYLFSGATFLAGSARVVTGVGAVEEDVDYASAFAVGN